MSGESISQLTGPRAQIAATGPAGAPAKPNPQALRQSLPDGGQPLPVATPRPAEVSVEQAVGELNDYVQSVNRELEFSIDDESGRTIIRVIDAKTQETIRQIPAEEMLAIAEQLRNALDQAKGFFLQAEA